MNGFRDYVRAEAGFGVDPKLPMEKLSHLIRPSKTGVPSHGLRTLCGLGQSHRVWRVTIEGAARNVNGDGWAVCVACAQRARRYLDARSTPQSSPASDE